MGGMLHANENVVAFEGERRQYRAMLNIQATHKLRKFALPARRATFIGEVRQFTVSA